MARDPQPLPTALGTAFTLREARAAGISRARLSSHDLERALHGVYAARPTEESAARTRQQHVSIARALMRSLDARYFLTGHSAALAWGLPVPLEHRSSITVGALGDAPHVRRQGVAGSRHSARLVTLMRHDGVQITSPACTWALLGAKLTTPDAVALGDAIIRRHRIPGTDRVERPSLATKQELTWEAMRPYRMGRELLLQHLDLMREESASAPETHLRLMLHSWGLTPTALDVDVYGADGRLLGCSEIAYPDERVAVEYEGRHHLFDPKQWNRDIVKYADYEEAGWRVIRVTAEMLYRRPATIRERVLQALAVGRSG